MPLVSWKKASMVTMSRPDMIQDAWKATWVFKRFPFSMNLQQMVPLQPWLVPCRKLYTPNCLDFPSFLPRKLGSPSWSFLCFSSIRGRDSHWSPFLPLSFRPPLHSSTATSPVFLLTVVGRRVLPLEGGRGESMIIVGCRLTVGPTTCSVSTFAGKRKGFPFRNPPNLKKWSKGRKIILQIGLFLLGLKGGALCIPSEFALARVWRECGTRV